MGRLHIDYIQDRIIYTCLKCKTDLAAYSDLISKNFTGKTGKAFLFYKVLFKKKKYRYWKEKKSKFENWKS